jgi:hypothetical protein
VLACRPSDAGGLSYVGLADLLDPIADQFLARLPPIQRKALESVLLLGSASEDADERAVAAGLLRGLRELAAEMPLCLAIDDVNWLDPPSLSALRFVLERLDSEPIVTVLAVRGSLP